MHNKHFFDFDLYIVVIVDDISTWVQSDMHHLLPDMSWQIQVTNCDKEIMVGGQFLLSLLDAN